MKRILITLSAVALLACTAVVAPALASGSKKKAKPTTYKIAIGDNYYTQKVGSKFVTPAKPTIKVGDSVKWQWPATGDTHDVSLEKGPKGVSKWASPQYSSKASWTKKFTKTGTYRLVCTFHQDMTMVVTVKK